LEDIKEVNTEEINKEIKETNIEIEQEKKASDKILIGAITVIILIIAVIIGMQYLQEEETPKTIDDLHSLNLKGKLKAEEGYVTDSGHSFVFANDLWYTQVQRGNNLYDIALHYGPKDLEDIPGEGMLNRTMLNEEREIYITFDPLGSNLQYVALAVGEFDQNIIKVFGKAPIASCDKNETEACSNRPIITCDNKDKLVLYLQQEPEAKVIFKDNCMIVQGIGPDIVRSTNRLLLKLYGIMQ